MTLDYIIKAGDDLYMISGAETVPEVGEYITALFGGHAMYDLGHSKEKNYRVIDVRHEVIIEDNQNSPLNWKNSSSPRQEHSESMGPPVVYVRQIE